MLKKRLFEVEKKSEKKVKTATNFFQRSNLISILKYEKKFWIYQSLACCTNDGTRFDFVTCRQV